MAGIDSYVYCKYYFYLFINKWYLSECLSMDFRCFVKKPAYNSDIISMSLISALLYSEELFFVSFSVFMMLMMIMMVFCCCCCCDIVEDRQPFNIFIVLLLFYFIYYKKMSFDVFSIVTVIIPNSYILILFSCFLCKCIILSLWNLTLRFDYMFLWANKILIYSIVNLLIWCLVLFCWIMYKNIFTVRYLWLIYSYCNLLYTVVSKRISKSFRFIGSKVTDQKLMISL